jgi:hypothetical protein
MNNRYGLLLPAMLVVLLFVGSVSAVTPAIPSPPYNPKSPAEDIITVEAWLEPMSDSSVATATSTGAVANEYMLHLTIVFGSGTPAGHTLYILLTQLKFDPGVETVIDYETLPGPSGNTQQINKQIFAVGMPDIAVYAWLDTPGTDRAPNDGFYSITSLSAQTPNVFQDPEGSPVGGVVMPTNKTEILAPLLAIAGIVAAVSTVELVVRRRKD